MAKQKKNPAAPNANTYVIDGRHYTRVTRILSVIHEDGLEAWKRKVGYDEAQRVMEEAAAFGTRVHTIVEGVNKEPLSYKNLDAELDPWYQSYSAWHFRNVVETVATECRVHSDMFLYAGTFDMKQRLTDGKLYMVDAKTNRTAVSPKARLQMSAYNAAEREMGEEEVDGRLVIWMPSSSPGKLVPIPFDNDQADLDAFYGALKIYRWRELHKNDWKQGKSW